MFRLDEALKVYLHREPIDFRLNINGLALLVEKALGLDPFAASVYVFSNHDAPRSLRRLTEAPKMVDLSGFGQFLQNLRNQGMQPVLMGDFPAGDDPRPASASRGRPYLVK